jgi:hypothetical protein
MQAWRDKTLDVPNIKSATLALLTKIQSIPWHVKMKSRSAILSSLERPPGRRQVKTDQEKAALYRNSYKERLFNCEQIRKRSVDTV